MLQSLILVLQFKLQGFLNNKMDVDKHDDFLYLQFYDVEKGTWPKDGIACPVVGCSGAALSYFKYRDHFNKFHVPYNKEFVCAMENCLLPKSRLRALKQHHKRSGHTGMKTTLRRNEHYIKPEAPLAHHILRKKEKQRRRNIDLTAGERLSRTPSEVTVCRDEKLYFDFKSPELRITKSFKRLSINSRRSKPELFRPNSKDYTFNV